MSKGVIKQYRETTGDKRRIYPRTVTRAIHRLDGTPLDEVLDRINGKQDIINDIDKIRKNAALGASALQEETDPTVPEWAKRPKKPTYRWDEIEDRPVIPEVTYDSIHEVLGYHPASESEIPTKVSELQNDADYATAAKLNELKDGIWDWIVQHVAENESVEGFLSDLTTEDKSNLVAAINEVNAKSGQGGGGTSDYSDLENKPKIDGVEIVGDKTAHDFGLMTLGDGVQLVQDLSEENNALYVAKDGIKTINGESIVGEGDITIEGGSVDEISATEVEEMFNEIMSA